MPFCPLPTTFLDDLARADGGVLELGAGGGDFTRLLRERGARVVALDRRRGAAQVLGDALAPPVRPRSFSLVVVANLTRHLWRRFDPASGPAVWRDLVAPGGSLYIFEDQPARAPRAVRNYRDLQAFLAGLHDLRRGPLLPFADFAAARARWRWPGEWCDGMVPNGWPANPEAVLALLTGDRRDAGGPADKLRQAIARDGLAYGSYWWARWSGEARDA